MPLHPDHRAGLEAALNSARMMVKYYREGAETSAKENAAMEAAGLKPKHAEHSIKYARQSLTNHQSQAEALEYLLDRDNSESAA